MRILAVDDDPQALGYLSGVLRARHDVTTCSDGAEALARLGTQPFDVVVTDLRMPPPDGFEVLKVAQQLMPPTPVIVLSALNTARAAVEALRLGARDFLVKPAEPEEIARAIAGLEVTPDGGGRAGQVPAAPPQPDFGLVGDSAPMRLVRKLIPALARSGEAVLILGETGTGKELLARALHAHGPRSGGPFIAHNMAATPAELAESIFFGHLRGAFSGANADHRGLFEQADGGTLFLDETDSFPFALQAKLLRVLEGGRVRRVGSTCERAVDVRAIAASAFDLGDLVAKGAFRADLYYRLRQLEVMLPPLRERASDIPALVSQFLRELAAEKGGPVHITQAALDLLFSHKWPGNVRELRNAVRAGAVMAGMGTILPEHLPRELSPRHGVGAEVSASSLRGVESEHILKTLESVGGNRSRAARMLGIDRGTLARRLASLERERRKT